ncbi:MAG: DUF1003 domain-containing protein [Gemmatimonadaceae bacterium]
MDVIPSESPSPPVRGRRRTARVIDRNIRALVAERAEEERARSREERIADVVTTFAGSMRFVYLHLAIFGAWITVNLGRVPGVPKFDPSFVILAMFASVEAIFLSTFVLITQNRMSELAGTRADLDLQISLLSEHELTRVVRLVAAIGNRLGLEEARDPELDELGRDVDPEAVLKQIEVRSEEFERSRDEKAH